MFIPIVNPWDEPLVLEPDAIKRGWIEMRESLPIARDVLLYLSRHKDSFTPLKRIKDALPRHRRSHVHTVADTLWRMGLVAITRGDRRNPSLRITDDGLKALDHITRDKPSISLC